MNGNIILVRIKVFAQQHPVHRAIWAYNPYPVAYTELEGEVLRIWKAEPIAMQAKVPAGTIIDITSEAINVACGEGMLQIQEIQWPSRDRQSINDALHANGHPFALAKRFG